MAVAPTPWGKKKVITTIVVITIVELQPGFS